MGAPGNLVTPGKSKRGRYMGKRGKDGWACKHCDEIFRYQRHLRRHLMAHYWMSGGRKFAVSDDVDGFATQEDKQFAELMQKKYGQLEIKLSADDEENSDVDHELEFALQLQE